MGFYDKYDENEKFSIFEKFLFGVFIVAGFVVLIVMING